MSMDNVSFDTILHGGLVLDPATGRNGMFDIGVTGGRVAAIEPDLSKAQASEKIDVTGKLVTAGMIDTHAHVYQHVTGRFGLEPDLVGVRSAVTTLVDQGGPSCMTIGGFKNFLAKKSDSRMLCYMSCYLVGGLEGHLYPDLHSPNAMNIDHSVRVARENRAMVRGIKGHAEIGGASRWGLEVLKMAKEIARQAELPLYIHLGQMWPSVEEGDVPSADELIRALVPLMDPGDVLSHPFTRHPGGFVSMETGEVHPIVFEALARGVLVDVGHGSHFSFEMAKRVLDAGVRPFTLGADLHGYNVQVPGEGVSEEERSANPFGGSAPFNLTVAMSELLALGLTLDETVATVTSNPAKLLKMEDEIGSLQVGRMADISVVEILNGRFKLSDNSGVDVVTDRLVSPRFCLREGRRIEANSPLIPPPFYA
jgi:dihydroorotase